jgi:hypothetical protein
MTNVQYMKPKYNAGKYREQNRVRKTTKREGDSSLVLENGAISEVGEHLRVQ